MKKIRHFACPDCGIIERMVEDDVLVINCECKQQMKRTLSAPKYFGNSCGKSPSTSNRKG